MQTDKDLGAREADDIVDVEEQTEEERLQWLLDMDLSEPEEKLFTVDGDEYCDEGLSDFEAEVAARPMFRGNAGGDDLANYVDEEIVISSESARSDIYGVNDESAAVEEESRPQQIMAIDYSRRNQRSRVAADNTPLPDEGTDILGLASDDDIGETYLTIKRVRSASGLSGKASHSPAGNGDLPLPGVLKDAPVTSQVADPATQHVANDAGAEIASEDVAVPDSAVLRAEASDDGIENAVEPAGFDSVNDYVANMPQPQDDDAFDEYLLNGSHLQASAEDPEELVLAESDDVFSVDTGEATGIDYPEDFHALDVAQPDFAAELAASIPAVIEEIAAAAEQRCVALGRSVGSLQVEAMLGTDEQSIRECYAQGFEPVSAVFVRLPQALQDFAAAASEAVYLRLQDSATGESCNDLFNTDVDAAAEDALAQSPVDAHDDGYESTLADMLGDELESALSADDEAGQWLAGQAAALSNAAPAQEPVALSPEAAPGAVESELDSGWDLDDKLEDLLGDSLETAAEFTPEAESGAPEAGLDTGWDLDDLLEDSAEQVRDGAVEVQEQAQDDVRDEWPTAAAAVDVGSTDTSGFGEDIFGDSFADDFEGEWSVSEHDVSSDIDAAFSALSAPDSEPAADEICGVDLEEFGSKESVEPVVELTGEEVGNAQTLAGQAGGVGVPPAANDASDLAWCIPPHIKFSYTTQSGAEIFTDFLDAFIEEGSSEIEKLEDLISEWEQDINAEEVYAQVSRTLHTLKGIGKGVGLQRFGTLIHNFETLLDALPRPDVDDAASYFRVVNVWLDAVVRGIDFVGKQRRDIASELPQPGKKDATESAAAEPVVREQADPVGEESREQSVEPGVSPDITRPAAPPQSAAAAEREKKRDKQLADEGAKALAAQQSVRITPEKLDHLLNLASQTQQLCVRASQATTRGKRSTSELQGRLSSVRTHIAKIADRALLSVNARGMSSTPDMDALEMDQYSELQEAASILREGVEDLADLIDVLSRQNSQVETLLKQQSSVISSISSSIQAARVVPVSRLMPGLRRIVRTVSTDLGKVVTFKVLNEIGALDRDHYARLQVVLEHMVRNALDHGIESPEERLAAGKSNAGRITIDVRKSGGDYIVRLADDGRGIDPDAIRESAYNKGLDVDVDALSDEEAIRLIFHKGFSTASKLSEISGRGVGMDIVLSELQQIGGDVQIQSAVGLGTSFEVRIPSNVTVNGALLVTAADHSYAIPLNGLIAVEQVPVNEFFDAMDSGACLKLFDMACTPAYLATLCQGVGLPERNFWEGFVPVIVAGSEDRRMAIAIDNVQEALELVVRSLGSQFAAVPGLAGAATTADGEAIVALDLNLLVDSVGEEGGLATVAVHHDKDKTLLALVVDDSRTQRMVATSQLDTVGVETITAENGLVAIDLLNATHRLPDVVLLDVEMPVKDGIETLREIRKSQRYGHLPVIMVTSRTGAKHRAMAKEAGCNAYMGKPFNFPALIEQINVLTGYDLQLS